MSDLDIYNLNLEKIDKFVINESLSSAVAKPYALKNSVVNYLAAQRSGNHKAKQRSEVSYSTRKLYKQKGTGNARAGSAKSPLRRHGGTIFGPVVRDHSFKLNKKEKTLALRSVFGEKIRNENLKVFQDFNLSSHKTSSFREFLKNIGFDKCLVVSVSLNENLVLATRNLPNVKSVEVDSLNVFDLLKFKNVLVTKEAFQLLEARLIK